MAFRRLARSLIWCADSSPETRLLALLSPAPIDLDSLGRMLSLSPQILRAALTELDLAGKLVWHSGGRVSLNA
jgi:predicted Rossmann fold nucleotide-binding protein DprA/Smf involved in DNA uptake